MKDASPKPKCPLAVQTEPLQKPLVLLRLSKSPLDDTNEQLAEKETNMELSEEADDATEEEHSTNGYTLVELNKVQLQQLIDGGNLQLVESSGASSVKENIQGYNLNADDWVDDDQRSRKRPWRRIQRIVRRQLVKIPRRYLKKIAYQIG